MLVKGPPGVFPALNELTNDFTHDDVIKWEHFSRYWLFVRGIHRSLVTGHRWRGALMFSLICAWINGSVINREAGDLRRHRSHYNVIVMNYHLSRHQVTTYAPSRHIISRKGLLLDFYPETHFIKGESLSIPAVQMSAFNQ